jgi:hypothetical protein
MLVLELDDLACPALGSDLVTDGDGVLAVPISALVRAPHRLEDAYGFPVLDVSSFHLEDNKIKDMLCYRFQLLKIKGKFGRGRGEQRGRGLRVGAEARL